MMHLGGHIPRSKREREKDRDALSSVQSGTQQSVFGGGLFSLTNSRRRRSSSYRGREMDFMEKPKRQSVNLKLTFLYKNTVVFLFCDQSIFGSKCCKVGLRETVHCVIYVSTQAAEWGRSKKCPFSGAQQHDSISGLYCHPMQLV